MQERVKGALPEKMPITTTLTTKYAENIFLLGLAKKESVPDSPTQNGS